MKPSLVVAIDGPGAAIVPGARQSFSWGGRPCERNESSHGHTIRSPADLSLMANAQLKLLSILFA